jgi:hydroxypyruvate reductase/glycerate 2-kinase
VEAARPAELVRQALEDPALPIREALARAPRIIVVGAGKAGAAMAAGVEAALASELERVEGLVNVPDDPDRPVLRKIIAHPARPAGTNSPTPEGEAGARRMLALLAGAGPEDVALCLLSGGGSALLPAPAPGLTLQAKQQVTRLLHACGATINEMNCVRKHLSAVKGGRLAQAFRGRVLFSPIISDVIGDPLDVIASGPTAGDPTTFADALAILERYGLTPQVPAEVLHHLRRGAAGEIEETPFQTPAHVYNLILGNNARSLEASARLAERLGYRVVNLGSCIEGETAPVAIALAGMLRSAVLQGRPAPPPLCLLSGGETTVTLTPGHGKGGRNQELVLAAGFHLRQTLPAAKWVVLSGGTDGEDGPTDAAGAIADTETFARAETLKLSPRDFLVRHDSHAFFQATGDLLQTGLTGTNVMDVRVFLVR